MKKVIASRGSKLALWQANHIKSTLESAHPGLKIDILVLVTKGDKILDVPLAKVGGKGLFVKEIEDALLDGRADLAVHSMKDVPVELPEGLVLGAVPPREAPHDLLLSVDFDSLDDLPKDAIVGTSSLRRQSQLLALRSDLRIVSLRGNVDTRLRKLHEGEFDAIVMAAAGVNRLDLSAPSMTPLAPPSFIPAVGQGALGIEYRSDDAETAALCAVLDHPPTRLAVEAERGFLTRLEGGCQVPIAGFATATGTSLELTGLVAELDGSTVIRESATGPAAEAWKLGTELAQIVLDRGGKAILDRVYAG